MCRSNFNARELTRVFTFADMLIMLDFHATWCEPCKWAEPVMEEVLKNFNGRIEMQKVDIDKEPERARSYHILSVPTFVLLKDGQEVWRRRGFDVAAKMEAEITEAISMQ